MINFKKRVLSIAACLLVIVSIFSAISVSAISLAESFYSKSYYTAVVPASDPLANYYTKTCIAGTKGYYNVNHYVRAYIGGDINGPGANALADSGRRYFYCDAIAACTTPRYTVVDPLLLRYLSPTAYAKYGH